MNILQHRLQVIGDSERRLRLALDLINSHAVSDLDELQAVGEVNVEDALGQRLVCG
jgi:hypothetical protein